MKEIRNQIDALDLQLRDLLMQRMDCSYKVAEAKLASGDTTIYRADREASILENLGNNVPEDRKTEYLAVVRRIMESSRMYQYGLIYDWEENAFESVAGYELGMTPSTSLKVRLTRDDKPNAMSAILCMIGDYGFQMERMELVEINQETKTATFDLTINGDITQTPMRKMVYQISKESQGFRILENIA